MYTYFVENKDEIEDIYKIVCRKKRLFITIHWEIPNYIIKFVKKGIIK